MKKYLLILCAFVAIEGYASISTNMPTEEANYKLKFSRSIDSSVLDKLSSEQCQKFNLTPDTVRVIDFDSILYGLAKDEIINEEQVNHFKNLAITDNAELLISALSEFYFKQNFIYNGYFTDTTDVGKLKQSLKEKEDFLKKKGISKYIEEKNRLDFNLKNPWDPRTSIWKELGILMPKDDHDKCLSLFSHYFELSVDNRQIRETLLAIMAIHNRMENSLTFMLDIQDAAGTRDESDIIFISLDSLDAKDDKQPFSYLTFPKFFNKPTGNKFHGLPEETSMLFPFILHEFGHYIFDKLHMIKDNREEYDRIRYRK